MSDKIKSCKDPDNIHRWVKYQPGMCDFCQAMCCALVVEVTADDLVRMELTDADEVTFGVKGLVKRLKKDNIIKRYNSKSGKFVLQAKKDNSCIFLDSNRRCKTYETRPEVCRNHPEKAGSKIGFCPYIAKDE
jgi:hypothetical protein